LTACPNKPKTAPIGLMAPIEPFVPIKWRAPIERRAVLVVNNT
jgi:hypothetical protein